jgi:hypothetical protein
MADEAEPVRIVLTPEQREVVRRLSGKYVEAIDLEPDQSERDQDKKNEGGILKFRWRLSAATGIPRQVWEGDGEETNETGGKEQS